MRINKHFGFVFISTPKACTHTIYKILDEHYSEGLIEDGFHNNKIPDLYQSYFRWTICRNPYSRMVSVWWSACRLAHKDQYGFRKRCGAKDDFNQFVRWLVELPLRKRQRDPLMMNQSEWLWDIEPVVSIRMENLEDGLKHLPFWKNGIEIPQLNTTDEKIPDREEEEGQTIIKPPWQEFYQDKNIQEAVMKFSEPDFARFGYSEEIP